MAATGMRLARRLAAPSSRFQYAELPDQQQHGLHHHVRAHGCAAMPPTSCGGLTVLKSAAAMFSPVGLRISSMPSRTDSPPQVGVEAPAGHTQSGRRSATPHAASSARPSVSAAASWNSGATTVTA